MPKPMLPVGDRPVLERTIRQLRRSGIRDVSMTTHYLGDRIAEHFGDGEEFGVRITYANEDQPLGTAGGLKTSGEADRTVRGHQRRHPHRRCRSTRCSSTTASTRRSSPSASARYVIDVPFGVVECDDVRITGLREKPSLTFFINAGIYLLEPTACDSIPDGEHFDMTDLIKRLLADGRTVVSFPIIEYWLDIGRPEDYQRAQDELGDGPG